MKEYSIIIYGRGGQGAKTLAQIIAEAGMIEGFNIQAFPEYGPERRGAPVRSFVRLSKQKIRKHYPVTHPDYLIIMDEDLLETNKEICKYKCPIIINSKKKHFKTYKNAYVIDASKIATELIKINSPNIVLVGVFLKIFKKIKPENVKQIIKEEFTNKNKKHVIEPNYKCLDKGYNYF